MANKMTAQAETSMEAGEAERFALGFRAALLEIYARTSGCERMVWPAECRGRNGYPRNEWCTGCIAGTALGIAPARPFDEEPAHDPPFPRQTRG